MRLKALIAIGAMMALPAFAQGTLTFLNTATGTGIPGGSKVVDQAGNPVGGATFWAQLYAELTPGSFTAIGTPVNFRTGAAAGFVASSQVAVPGIAVNGTVNVQMRAWEGAATYEAAKSGGQATGISNTINVGPLGGVPAVGPPVTDPFLTGLQGFAIIVPEPSTIVLGVLGLAALVLRRRK
jgi:hypothetical protein